MIFDGIKRTEESFADDDFDPDNFDRCESCGKRLRRGLCPDCEQP